MPETDNRIEVSELSCIRNDLTLFRDLAFSVKTGEILQVRGANGSGKSSLLRILCGFLRSDSGEVRWNGDEIQQIRAEYLGQLCYLGHLHGIKDDLTVKENLAFSAILDGARHDRESLDGALEQMKLSSHLDFPARKLSAGQKRRLAICRFILTKARLWVLDEPFTALDDAGKTLVNELISAHTNKGGLCVVATHEALQLAGPNIQGLEL